mmetsp:Transcript_42706/g.108571  ORF Transcript_42706/g.108571 Transcript_42706/m.108571 type:complete len:204 (-) Transcript_42706:4055-4666(-)
MLLAFRPSAEALAAIGALEAVGHRAPSLLRQFPGDLQIYLLGHLQRHQRLDKDLFLVIALLRPLIILLPLLRGSSPRQRSLALNLHRLPENRVASPHAIQVRLPQLRLLHNADQLLEGLHGLWVFPQQHLLLPSLNVVPALGDRSHEALPDLVESINHRRGVEMTPEEDRAPLRRKLHARELRARALRAAAGAGNETEAELDA